MPAVPAIDLVVTDLDGTLWHTDDHVHDDVVTTMAKVTELGVPLLVATGRRVTSTRVPLERIGLAPPAVVLNGALGLDLATGGRFHRAPFGTERAVAVLDAFSTVGLDPVVYVDHPRYDMFLSTTPSTHPQHVQLLADTAGTDDLARVVAEEVTLGFGIVGVPHRDGVAARDAIGGLAGTYLDRSLDHPGTVAFMAAPAGVSKWEGVLAFCAARRLDPRRVLAVADGPNDIELLDNAAVRLVPEIAHPAALDRADHLIAAAANGGWTAVLDHLT
ncbi:MAG TPA: HAD family hydrolase [Acidimicrobiales bacterium]